MAKRTPYLWRNVWNNFVNSLKTKPNPGVLVGEDHLGNKYFEIPADPSRGKRRPSRWFDPRKKDEFDANMPAEWEAWLRFRRTEPPTAEEIIKNLAIIEQKQTNAQILDARAKQERIEMGRSEPPQDVKGMYSFPSYSEFKTPKDDDNKK